MSLLSHFGKEIDEVETILPKDDSSKFSGIWPSRSWVEDFEKFNSNSIHFHFVAIIVHP